MFAKFLKFNINLCLSNKYFDKLTYLISFTSINKLLTHKLFVNDFLSINRSPTRHINTYINILMDTYINICIYIYIFIHACIGEFKNNATSDKSIKSIESKQAIAAKALSLHTTYY